MLIEKEIRIGNIFRFTGDWSYKHKKNDVFEWNFNDWYGLGECTLNLEDIRPIELTEEQLLKLGLDRKYYKDKVVWVTNHYMFIDFIFYLELKKDGFMVFNSFNFFLKELKYVHQLQNIYYDLTGDELSLSD